MIAHAYARVLVIYHGTFMCIYPTGNTSEEIDYPVTNCRHLFLCGMAYLAALNQQKTARMQVNVPYMQQMGPTGIPTRWLVYKHNQSAPPKTTH